MNHIYRVIWNECAGAWVAIPETARSCGKGRSRAARKALLAVLMLSGLAGPTARAVQPAVTVVPVGGNATAYISANGVPVVNIEKAGIGPFRVAALALALTVRSIANRRPHLPVAWVARSD